MNKKAVVWLSAIVISGLLLAFVFINLDIDALKNAAGRLRLMLMFPVVILLTAEAMVTAKRIQYFTSTSADYSQGLYANAWYVLWLNILPARLGEIAAISVFKNVFSVTAGAAAANIVTQRLFDLLVLTVILLGILSVNFLGTKFGLLINVALIVGALILIASIGWCLDALVRLLYQFKKNRNFARLLLIACLQGRRWYKRDFSDLSITKVVVLTIVKWTANILGIAILLMACQLGLPNNQLILVAVLANFLGAVPLQSVGGFGVIEAGLAGILYALGIPFVDSIATSLLIRIMTLLYVLAFFGVIVMLFRRKITKSYG